MNIGIIIFMCLVILILVAISMRIGRTNQILLTLINAQDKNHLLLREIQLKKPSQDKENN